MMNDQQFVKSFSWMIFWLVILTVALISIGAVIGGSIDEKRRLQTQLYTQQIVEQRTQPVGSLNIGELPPVQPSAMVEPVVQVAQADTPGKAVYDTACFICHATGVTGAPKPGDVEDWTPRIAQGADTLYEHAIKGFQGQKGIMPPKGGNLALSDEDVKAAVDYLVSLIE